jgi:hypothetical protein
MFAMWHDAEGRHSRRGASDHTAHCLRTSGTFASTARIGQVTEIDPVQHVSTAENWELCADRGSAKVHPAGKDHESSGICRIRPRWIPARPGLASCGG